LLLNIFNSVSPCTNRLSSYIQMNYPHWFGTMTSLAIILDWFTKEILCMTRYIKTSKFLYYQVARKKLNLRGRVFNKGLQSSEKILENSSHGKSSRVRHVPSPKIYRLDIISTFESISGAIIDRITSSALRPQTTSGDS